LIEKGYVSREVINWTQADVEKQFASGQVAMMINGPWQFSALADDAPDLEYGVTLVPRADDGIHASVLGGENVAICKGADVDASWTFLKWITSKEKSQEICKAIGYFSPRSDVDVQEMFAGDDLNMIFAEVMPSAQSRGPSPDWPEISAAIYTAQQEVFTGQKDVDTAMNDAQIKIDSLNK
ncbi:MAG: extracellular solute-binding protein, partial [Lachnospiraceae bacterium]